MEKSLTAFQTAILQGIPNKLPPKHGFSEEVNRAPKRKDILSEEEKILAVRNALRYFPKAWHPELAIEFAKELQDYGRIYMYRFKPKYDLYARPLSEYPAKSKQAAAIMLMIQNNLDPAIAQHPEELITYGGNGAVFQNWAQYLLTLSYLAQMTDEQTYGSFSIFTKGSSRGGYQRYDDSQLLKARSLGKV
jgi:urocanate hydratase